MKLPETDVQGFDDPVAAPQDAIQARDWQNANRRWWELHPMRYDWRDPIPYEPFTKEFYIEIDRRFFSQAERFLPSRRIPFDRLIDFNSLVGKAVLEIGVGSGSHAQLLAQHSGTFVGIDVTEYAIHSTQNRLKCFTLPGQVLRMDAEQMAFRDDSFDFIWTWGVIHHSSDTSKVLSEMYRVLRPGGTAVVMIYNRGWWNYYVGGGLVPGIFLGELFRNRSLHATVQRRTDGALARYFSDAEWRKTVEPQFVVQQSQVMGSKNEVLPFPGGRLKEAILALMPNGISRCLTNRCAMGGFLVTTLRSRKDR
jgi:ubiquinone/menaquinone biosynthesis C-methylase UbiE